jgi:hypothetical protein
VRGLSVWTVILPTSIQYGVKKPKPFYLNLNNYRNAPYHLLSDMKVAFSEIVSPRVTHLPPMDLIRISYYLFTGTRQIPDVANVCSIVDKFFCDVLTKQEIIPDDNPNHLSMVAYGFGGYEKGQPRVEAVIERLR